MKNNQNQNNSDETRDGDVIIHTLQDDLKTLGIAVDGGAATAKQAKDDQAATPRGSEGREESTSPFLSSVPSAGGVKAKPSIGPETAAEPAEKKKETEKPAAKKGGLFGLGWFSKKSDEQKKTPQKLPVKIIEPTPREEVKRAAIGTEEAKKPVFAPKPAPKEVFHKEEAKTPIFTPRADIRKEEEKRAFFAPKPAQQEPVKKEEVRRPFFSSPKPVQKEEARSGEVRRQLFTSPRAVQQDAFQKEDLKQSLPASRQPRSEVSQEKQPAGLKVATKTAISEKPKQSIAEKKDEGNGGIFGIFKKADSGKTEEEIKELENDRRVLEQKNKELEQTRLTLEVKVKQYTTELKEIKENEQKIIRHTEELKKSETSLDRQVIEKNQVLKEKLKQFEEFQTRTKEREVKMLELKTKIQALEGEVLARELKIKEAEKKTGLFGMIRKMRNRKLIETGENLRKIHYALENKNRELKKAKESLEEGVRNHLRELKELREQEEKAKKHLDEIKKNELDINQRVTDKSKELKEKFELLKANLEQQVVEKNSILKGKMEKVEEMNAKISDGDRKMAEFKAKIGEVEKEIAAKEAAAKAKLEELEKEIAAKKANATETIQKSEKEIAAKEAMVKARLEELEKEIAAKEATAKAKIAELEKKTSGGDIKTPETSKGSGIFGLFGKKSESGAEKPIKIEAPASLPIKAAPVHEIKNKTEANPGLNGISHVSDNQIKKDEPKKKIEMPVQPAATGKKPHWGRVFVTATTLVIIITVCAGSYIFLKTRSSSISIQNKTAPVAEPPVVEVTQTAFSLDKSNYLNIDVESTSQLKITQLLVSTSIEIKDEKISTPVEFLVTDTNNNPLAFSVFANLFGLSMSADALSSMEEGFSLYVYNDKDNSRVALAVDLKDKEKAVSELIKEEEWLNISLKSLFLGEPIEQGVIAFKNGQYKGLAVRYANLNSQNTTSLDYAFLDGQLVIGTSKDTLRAVIDKIGVVEQ